MKSIRTVLGDISTALIGHTQCHEHILVNTTPIGINNPDLVIDDFDKSLLELTAYRNDGGQSLVDAQPLGAGRNTMGLYRLAEMSNVNVVASTGYHKRMFYPDGHWAFSLDSDALASIFVHELLEGMYLDDDLEQKQILDGSKAGLIKIALDSENESIYENLLAAALDSCYITGAPILVHTDRGSNPLPLLDVARERDIPMDKIAVCHLDRTCEDLEIHEEVAKRGAFLEYDTIGRYKYHDDAHELNIISHMIDQGYSSQLLLSLDTTRARLISYGGQPGLSYLLTGFIPMLASRISSDLIDEITKTNPARYLGNYWDEL